MNCIKMNKLAALVVVGFLVCGCQGAHHNSSGRVFIDKLSMQRHPTSGWFVETYRSPERYGSLPKRYGANATRSFGSHIYSLLENDDFASFHRLKSDELWHFHAGSPLIVFVIDQVSGNLTRHYLGHPTKNYHVAIRHGDYYASRLRHPGKGKFCLVGITVTPGFEFEDYEEGREKEMLKLYRRHAKVIKSLTRI